MKLLESFVRSSLLEYLLIEGIYDVAKKKYVDSGKLDLDTFEYLRQNDPSQKNKYLDWMSNQLSNDLDLDPKYVIELIEQFHNNQKKLEKKDINQYKTITDLYDGLTQAEQKQGQQRASTRHSQYIDLEPGTKLIYKDDKYIILLPLTKSAVCHYGAGTKWCITQGSEDRDTDDMFEGYSASNTLFYYILDLTRKSKDSFYKVAISAERNEDNQFVGFEANDAEDKYLKKADLINVYGEFWDHLLSIIRANASQQPATEEYEIRAKHKKMKELHKELDGIVSRFVRKSDVLHANLKHLDQDNDEFTFEVAITGYFGPPASKNIYRISSEPHKLSDAIAILPEKEYIEYIKDIINQILDNFYIVEKVKILENEGNQPSISFKINDTDAFSDIDDISNVKDSLDFLLDRDLSVNNIILLLERQLVNDGKIENWLGRDDLENLQMENLYFEESVERNRNVLQVAFPFKRVSEEEKQFIIENQSNILSIFSKKIEKFADDIFGEDAPLELELGIPNSEFVFLEIYPKYIFNITHQRDVERGIFWAKFFEEHAEYIQKAFNDILSRVKL